MAASMIPNMAFELLLHTAFVANKNWSFMLEPARAVFDFRLCR